jgi:hypothetical protein
MKWRYFLRSSRPSSAAKGLTVKDGADKGVIEAAAAAAFEAVG